MMQGSYHHPVYSEIQELREKYQADLVGLITGNGGGNCGCGSRPHLWGGDTSRYAYFTTPDNCATENLSFVHEIGHAFVSIGSVQ